MIDKTNLRIETVNEYCIVDEKNQIIKDGFCSEEEAAKWLEDAYGIKHEPKPQPKIGSWIPCSERLPTKEESIKNDNRFILDDGNRRYGGMFDYEKQCFVQFDFWKGLVEDKCAIAWQPLPEAYHG